MAQVRLALAPSLADVDASAQQLLVDAFPATTVALLPEWEASVGLPDPCAGEAPTIAARQGQVVARLSQPGGQSKAFLTAYAASLGYVIEISNYAPYRVGLNSCVDPVATDDWAFFLLINVNAPSAPVLECEFRRLVSAETVLVFIYGAVELAAEDGELLAAEDGSILATG